MICTHTQELFSDFYDGALNTEQQRAIESHLASCATCRAEYTAFRNGLAALTSSGPVEVSERFVASTTLHIERVAPAPETVPLSHPPVRSAFGWLPLAIAATLLLGLAVGYLIARSTSNGELQGLRDRLAPLENMTSQPPSPLPDNVVIIAGKQFPISEYVEKKGLVRTERGWISEAMQEEIARNEARVREKIATLEKELETARATPPPPTLTKQHVLDELGLVEYRGMVIPKTWLENLDQGLVLESDGQWKKTQEILSRFVEENQLVEHNGRWMTKTEQSAMLAQQFVRRPTATPLEGPTATALDGLELAHPITYKNVTLYPLLASDRGTVTALSLHQAMAHGKLEIRDNAGPLSVSVKNDSNTDTLLLAGSILVGGRFARVVARDTLVPARKTALVRVYDVEPTGTKRSTERFDRESGHYLVTGALQRAIAQDAGQGYVWTAVAAQLEGLRKATSPVHVYHAHQTACAEYRSALIDLPTTYPEAIGFAAAIGGHLEGVEIFATPEFFRACYEPFLLAVVLEAVSRGENARGSLLRHSLAAVKQLIESAFACDAEPDEGIALRTTDGRAIGRAMVHEDLALHVSLYAPSDALDPRTTIEIHPDRVRLVLDDYKKRLEAAPVARKPAIIREIASLSQKPATAYLIQVLRDPDLQVRKTVLQALSRRGEAEAITALVNAFNEARRDPLLFPTAADALARSGSEAAIAPMLEVVEGKDPQLASIVADHIAPLLLQQRSDTVLSEAIRRLIDALERTLISTGVPGEAAYRTTLLAALRTTTGQNFADAVDWRTWWNDPQQKKKFLEERPK